MSSRYRRYDHRIKNMIATTGDPKLFPDLSIPLSTAREWIKYGIPKSTLRQWVINGQQNFFTIPELDLGRVDLVQENLTLKTQLASVTAQQDLVAKTIRIFGFQIQYKRLPSADAKSGLWRTSHQRALAQGDN